MNLKDLFKRKKRNLSILFSSPDAYKALCSQGYVSLDKNPEVVMGCRKIAELISSMTIYLMANTEKGDIRIVNELSRKVDILPSPWMTRKTLMEYVVMNLLLYGRGNSVVIPHTADGYLEELEPIPAANVSFIQNGRGYFAIINGKQIDPENILHFVFNPDKNFPWLGQGLTTTLQDITDGLKQASDTKKAFMESKYNPSLIIKVDALVDEFSTPEGRQKLLDEYITTTGAGEPWMIPAEQFSVEQIRPLSLADLAISDSVQIDKRSVAALLGVPPFVVGVGEYDAAEWDAFISNTIRPIARGIEQELTRKLLISPKMYWQFNIASHYAYDLRTTESVYADLHARGIVTGNEVRNKINMEPKDGLDELVILENYIPLSKTGDQLKLGNGDGNE